MSTGFHLLDHPNPNGPFYYTTRRTCQHGVSELPHLVVVHTAESLPDFEGTDTSGEALARYASTTPRSVSWHSTVDSDGTIPMLPDNYTAFHVVDYNRCAVGMEIATKAGLWVEASVNYPAWYNAIMGMAANQVAWWCKTYRLQPRRLTKDEADRGLRGVISHQALDPTRRTDPGAAFAWTRFLSDVNARLTEGGYLDRSTWPTWAAASIQKAIDKKIMVADGKLWLPGSQVTRAELAVILDRVGLLE
jgi:hypothetical protein